MRVGLAIYKRVTVADRSSRLLQFVVPFWGCPTHLDLCKTRLIFGKEAAVKLTVR
jgi:hypothetical protein